MLISKIYYDIQFQLLSPLSIGGGEAFLTDHDCLKDKEGHPFIPATSLAGVFSHYLTEEQRALFTPKQNGENIQSPFFISDAILVEKTANTNIRDGVKLDAYKLAKKGAKFDFEIVETGAKFRFRIEITVRERENIDPMKEIVDCILSGLKKGEILLGFKSKRGYGKVTVCHVGQREFRKENLEEFLAFDKYNPKEYLPYEIKEKEDGKYDYIQVRLKQLGGISIRKYSAKAGNVDFEHITSGGKPVIPGTSWCGLFRGKLTEYMEEEPTLASVPLTDWFGKPKEKGENTGARASNIIFEESVIEDAVPLELTRNKIDRFAGGAADRALFNERAWYNGKTVLGIKVKKQIPEEADNTKMIGLLALVIKEIDNGLAALGGQTSIGRGIFQVEGVTKNGKELDLEEAISKILEGGGKEDGGR